MLAVRAPKLLVQILADGFGISQQGRERKVEVRHLDHVSIFYFKVKTKEKSST